MFITTGGELQFKPSKFVTLIANVRLNYGFWETPNQLHYAGYDGTCDHSWLTMLLGNCAPAQAGLLAGFREVLGTFQLVAKHQIGPSVILVSMIFYYSF